MFKYTSPPPSAPQILTISPVVEHRVWDCNPRALLAQNSASTTNASTFFVDKDSFAEMGKTKASRASKLPE